MFAARFLAREIQRGKARGLKNPSGQDGAPGYPPGLTGQIDEDGLRDFLRLMRIAAAMKGGMVGQAGVAIDQRPERLVRAPVRVSLKKLPVIHLHNVLHS